MNLIRFSILEQEIIIYNREKPRRDTMGTCSDVFWGSMWLKSNFAYIFSSKTSKMVIFDEFWWLPACAAELAPPVAWAGEPLAPARPRSQRHASAAGKCFSARARRGNRCARMPHHSGTMGEVFLGLRVSVLKNIDFPENSLEAQFPPLWMASKVFRKTFRWKG